MYKFIQVSDDITAIAKYNYGLKAVVDALEAQGVSLERANYIYAESFHESDAEFAKEWPQIKELRVPIFYQGVELVQPEYKRKALALTAGQIRDLAAELAACEIVLSADKAWTDLLSYIEG